MISRRRFVARTVALAAASAGLVSACGPTELERPRASRRGLALTGGSAPSSPDGEWAEVRRQFELSEDQVHLSALLISSHPRPVREAIEEYRRELDRNPVVYLQTHNERLHRQTRSAAAAYLGASPDDIALTDSTTMGLGLVYNGLRLRRGQEIVTTEHDYYATHEAVRLAAERSGASVRQISLYRALPAVSADEIVERVTRSIRRQTRVLALTWVHSSTGLKLPLARIARAVREVNARRDEADRVLLAVDAVHGFGVEDVEMTGLGVDYYIAGCHKWLFGPRGTGIVWANGPAWRALRPTIPSFIDDGTWQAWRRGETPKGPTTATRMTPGGFKAFEHQWALARAFEFHDAIGKNRVQARTRLLSGQLKQGLAAMPHVTLHTPRSEELSAGIVCFEVAKMSAWAAADRLRERGIIATVTPYAVRYARLTPSIRNSPEEIEAALRVVRDLA
jgi:isopenicillin-N epimerase